MAQHLRKDLLKLKPCKEQSTNAPIAIKQQLRELLQASGTVESAQQNFPEKPTRPEVKHNVLSLFGLWKESRRRIYKN